MSASNTFDMLRILDSSGNRSNLKYLDLSVREFLEKIINDIQKGQCFSEGKKSKNIDTETGLFFSKDNVMAFFQIRYKKNQVKYSILQK